MCVCRCPLSCPFFLCKGRCAESPHTGLTPTSAMSEIKRRPRELLSGSRSKGLRKHSGGRDSGNRLDLTQWTHHCPEVNGRLCQSRSLDLPCGHFAQPPVSLRCPTTQSLRTEVNTHGSASPSRESAGSALNIRNHGASTLISRVASKPPRDAPQVSLCLFNPHHEDPPLRLERVLHSS